ncbi:NAC domain-containing protein 48-like [Argentina anserina]|uniref:NAC domain-containing protein 48-like n=1 Tax=Argentina anserina TaxID=57926 RepID=UPI00217678A6|nr:NAC domain-containing protein 48-like [Potentilla anserina]
MDGDNKEMRAMYFNQAVTDEYFRSLPPGYRFNPTDQELIIYYLNRKILNQPLPLNRIHDLNIYQYQPQQLSDMYEKIREDGWYFFSTRDRKYQNGTRPNRAAHGGCGCWKATGSGVNITDESGKKIGHKRVLEYKKGRHPNYIKTEWKMHEYTINKDEKEAIPLPKKKKKGEGNMKLDVVLCKIYLNTRGNGDTNSDGAITPTENSDQGIMITDAGTSHVREISVLQQKAVLVQPLDSSTIYSQQPQVHSNTTGGFNCLNHISGSSAIPENCFYSSTSMSNEVYESTNCTPYDGGSMANRASGSVYQWGSSFTQFHHQNSKYNMYSEQMPSSSCSPEIWTQSEPENHEIPPLDDSTYVSLPAHHHVTEYGAIIANNNDEAEMMPVKHVNKVDDVDDYGLQFLSFPDEVQEDNPKTD